MTLPCARQRARRADRFDAPMVDFGDAWRQADFDRGLHRFLPLDYDIVPESVTLSTESGFPPHAPTLNFDPLMTRGPV